ncbi:unnamed protein product [Meloidogyne enterolobii]|uniref:Uncharacterized protein n=3 Tax=Meloidogyne enterolobii TaxID=390850 RepID=A0ACB1AM59_MELEN|nr:unnamed protein product [Meloidogyne enterolobii]
MKDKSTTISSSTTKSTKQPKTTTANNHRRAISLKRKPKLIGRKEIINPLSIDALEFDLNKEMSSKLNGGGREEEKEKSLDVVSVHSVDDLIDLNDDKEEGEEKKEGIKKEGKTALLSSNNHLHSHLHSSIHSSPNLYIQATTTTPNSNSPNNSSSFSSNSQSLIIPNGNTLAYTRSLQSEQFKRKNNWETFD